MNRALFLEIMFILDEIETKFKEKVIKERKKRR